MMSHSNFLKCVAAFLSFAVSVSSSPDIHVMPLNVKVISSLADVFESTIRGRDTFHLPDVPQFRHQLDFKSPRKYSAFYKTNAGKMTLGAFMRFIEDGHKLFADQYLCREYRQTLADAIDAHKEFFYRPSVEKEQLLVEAQKRVLTCLKSVALTESILKQLEELLSTPQKNLLQKIGSFISSIFTLPLRTIFTKDQNDAKNVFINRGNMVLQFIGQTALIVLLAVVIPVLRAWGTYSFFPKFREPEKTSVLLFFAGLSIVTSIPYYTITALISCFGNYKLAPEPYPVAVVIRKNGLLLDVVIT